MDRFQLSCLGLFCLVFLILTCIKQSENGPPSLKRVLFLIRKDQEPFFCGGYHLSEFFLEFLREIFQVLLLFLLMEFSISIFMFF